MLSILVLSHKGEGYELATRLANEHHLVKYWSQTPFELPKNKTSHRKPQVVDRYEGHLDTADIVLQYGAGGHPRAASAVAARGGLVLGGGVPSKLNVDMTLAKAWSGVLELGEAKVDAFIGGMFDGEKYIDCFEGFNYRRLLDYERGPDLGTMGCLVWKASDDSQKLLAAVTELLASVHYQGFFGLMRRADGSYKFYVGEDNLWFYASMELWTKQTLADYLYAVATKTLESNLQDRFGLAVRAVSYKPLELTPHPKALTHLWVPANNKSVAIATACGEDVREARRRIYRTLTNNLPIEAIYRLDIGYSQGWEGDANATETR